MNKDKINKEKKEKAKNIAFKILHGVSYALSTCFIATCIVACASSGAKNKSNNSPKSLIQYRIDGESESESVSESELVSYPIYDDLNQSIIFSAYQLNNYSWNNYYEIFSSYYSGSDISYNYNNESVIYGEELSSSFQYSSNSYILYLITDYQLFNTEEQTNYTKNYSYALYSNSDSYINFDSELKLNVIEGSYSQIKQAIELDIQANEEIESPTSDIFTAISDTITNFIIALNSGITAIVGLFWSSSSSALTPLGVLTTIVVGVALAYFLFRLISGLIRLRG